MKLKTISDPANSQRNRALGDFGEQLAHDLLIRAGFSNIVNLNTLEMNYLFADLLAERDGERFVISVKTRMKFERLGGLNARYNLGKDWKRKAAIASRRESAIPAWVTVPVDSTSCAAYFGLVSLIEESNGVPMQPEALPYYECLGEGIEHGLNWDDVCPRYQVAVHE